jgi:hypothetical protein
VSGPGPVSRPSDGPLERESASRAGSAVASSLDGSRTPSFLIVGSPRSGTTLVQRLASELTGVAVPPETHFVPWVTSRRMRGRFPLDEASLRESLQTFVSRPFLRGLDLDIDGVVVDLGARCARPIELFGAILRRLSKGATVIGEKTPTHLLALRPLTAAMPWVKVVALVRDPRGVVASNLSSPWAGDWHHLTAAARWAFDQSLVARVRGELGPDRLMVLRYEDVVTDPNGTRLGLARFLGLPSQPGPTAIHEPVRMFLPWETWKKESLGPITTDHVERWRQLLSPRQADEVVAVSRRGMLEFGYSDGVPSHSAALFRLARVTPVAQLRRLHARRGWQRQVARYETTPL